MSDVKLTIESFTVSYALDVFKGGEKTSHFLSASVKAEPAIPLEEFSEYHLRAGKRVCLGLIQHAVVRQAMTADEGRDRMKEIEENYDGFIQALRKKQETP